MPSKTVRVDSEVYDRLLRFRLPSERNFDGAVLRGMEFRELGDQLRDGGLTTEQMGRYHALEALLERDVPA